MTDNDRPAVAIIPAVLNENLTGKEYDDFLEQLQTDFFAGKITSEEYDWHLNRENAIYNKNLEDA